MAAPDSMDLRERLYRAWVATGDADEVAATFGVSWASVHRLLQRKRKTGSLPPGSKRRFGLGCWPTAKTVSSLGECATGCKVGRIAQLGTTAAAERAGTEVCVDATSTRPLRRSVAMNITTSLDVNTRATASQRSVTSTA